MRGENVSEHGPTSSGRSGVRIRPVIVSWHGSSHASTCSPKQQMKKATSGTRRLLTRKWQQRCDPTSAKGRRRSRVLIWVPDFTSTDHLADCQCSVEEGFDFLLVEADMNQDVGLFLFVSRFSRSLNLLMKFSVTTGGGVCRGASSF